jgi:hypothetical protein
MDLVLHLPGLLDVHGTAIPAPGLARLIAAAEATVREPDGAGAALAGRFGIARQRDWPLAPVRLAARGVDPGAWYWLVAEPVTLVAGRDDVRLTGAVTDLAPGDAATLVAELNAHFAADGVVFVAPATDAWFVRAPAPARLVTRPLATAVDRPLRGLLPNGEDAAVWRRWGQEIEMLVHDHPVNVERSRTGLPPVSAVWFSFGGTLPRVPVVGTMRAFARTGDAVALARHAQVPLLPLPASLGEALAAAAGAATIVVGLDAGTDLGAVDAAWAAPAYAALTRRTLDTVTLIGDGAGGGAAACWTAHRPGTWRRLTARFAARDLDARFGALRGER